MLRVGLTGGIGAGKSAVASYLASLGAVIIDADQLAREVVARGTPGLAEVASVFGPGVLANGELDRTALAGLVFADAAARGKLEAIIHPRVRARTHQLAAEAGDAIVVNDVPLLVETGLAPTFHLVLVVEADRGIRLERLIRRGLPRAAAEDRMAAQADDAARRAAADIVLDNSGALTELHEQLDRVWARLAGYAANLQAGRPAQRSEELAIVASDPTWPAQYARIAARIRLATGDSKISVAHIGSTAVPNLPAKDVVDIQLGVDSLAAAADAFASKLATMGFPRRAGTWRDNPKPPAVEPWPKRLHANADPGRPVNVHVRVAGSPGWRWALLFRDWLRANPEEVARYAAEKTRLATAGLTVGAYAEAKEPWFNEVHTRAEAWAAQTHWSPRHGA